MWPFKKEPKEPKIYYEEINRKKTLERIKNLEDKFKKGVKFQYLGVDCLVTRTVDYYDSFILTSFPYQSIPTVSSKAVLFADYVDKNGVIRELELSYCEAMRVET